MKITDINCHVMCPLGIGADDARSRIFVEVMTDEGLTGIGEASTEFHAMAVKAQVDTELRPRLLGLDPTDIEHIWQSGYRDFWWRRGVVHTSAMSGIDQALWDIAGKAAGLPVYKLLGGAVRRTVRCYIRYGIEYHGLSLDEAAAKAKASGIGAFKHALGRSVKPFDPHRQIDTALADHRKLREFFGPDVKLMCDAQGLFGPTDSARLLEGLRPLGMHFVEEPTNMDTVEPTLRLKQAFPDIPIALGERLMTRWDCRPWFERQAIDICQVDISHTGGISEMMKIAHFAEVYGIRIAPHNPYGPVALAAAAHVCAAIQNFDLIEHCPVQPLWDEMQSEKLPLENGRIDVAELGRRPGLGVALDMDYVKSRHTFEADITHGRNLEDGSLPLM